MNTYDIPNITLIARALRQRTTANVYYYNRYTGKRPTLSGTRSQILNQARSLTPQFSLDLTEGLHKYVTPLEKAEHHQRQHDAYLAGVASDISEILSELGAADRAQVLQTLTLSANQTD